MIREEGKIIPRSLSVVFWNANRLSNKIEELSSLLATAWTSSS
jgi:hypothetical protein